MNPWFETQKNPNKPYYNSKPGTSTNDETEQSYSKNIESLFRAKPIHLSDWKADESLKEEIDYSNFLKPELSLLEQLEKEHSERRELLKNPHKKVIIPNYERQKTEEEILPKKHPTISSIQKFNNSFKKQNKQLIKLEKYYCFECKDLIENVVRIEI